MTDGAFGAGLMADILAQPLWLVAWVSALMLVNTASLLFIARLEARWVLAAWIGNILLMSALYEWVGFVRLLGLSHIVFWTPLLIYLWQRRRQWGLDRLSGQYLALLFALNAISLAIDYIDVARWILGERAPLL